MTQTTPEPIDAFSSVSYSSDPYDEIPEYIPRDQWGRPKIKMPDGTVEPYSRCSSLAGTIENKKGLAIWDVRNIVRGVGLREDLAAMAAGLPSITGDKRKDELTNKTLDEIAEVARDVAGEHAGRNWGSAVHSFTEPGMQEFPYVPERMKPDVRSYWDCIEKYRVRLCASEVFVVNDELKVAGTFDDLYYTYAYGLTVADKKTGRKNMHSVIIQMAVYANSMVYDPVTGERSPLQSLVPPELRNRPINLDTALYVHIPKGEGRTDFLTANIRQGYEAAKVAAAARDFQRMKTGLVDYADEWMTQAARSEAAWEMLNLCTTRDDMVGVANEYRDVWTDAMTRRGREILGG